MAAQEALFGGIGWTEELGQKLQEEIDAIFGDSADDGSVVSEDLEFEGTDLKKMEFSLTIADPNLEGCPLVGCSVGFKTLCGYEMNEIVGRNCRFLVDPVPAEFINRNVRRIARDYCDAVRDGKQYTLEPEQKESWMPRPRPHDDGVFLYQVNARKNGDLFNNMFYLKRVELEDKPYIVGLQTEMDLDNAGMIDACHKACRSLDKNFGSVERALAHRFWISTGLRRQDADGFSFDDMEPSAAQKVSDSGPDAPAKPISHPAGTIQAPLAVEHLRVEPPKEEPLALEQLALMPRTQTAPSNGVAPRFWSDDNYNKFYESSREERRSMLATAGGAGLSARGVRKMEASWCRSGAGEPPQSPSVRGALQEGEEPTRGRLARFQKAFAEISRGSGTIAALQMRALLRSMQVTLDMAQERRLRDALNDEGDRLSYEAALAIYTELAPGAAGARETRFAVESGVQLYVLDKQEVDARIAAPRVRAAGGWSQPATPPPEEAELLSARVVKGTLHQMTADGASEISLAERVLPGGGGFSPSPDERPPLTPAQLQAGAWPDTPRRSRNPPPAMRKERESRQALLSSIGQRSALKSAGHSAVRFS